MAAGNVSPAALAKRDGTRTGSTCHASAGYRPLVFDVG